MQQATRESTHQYNLWEREAHSWFDQVRRVIAGQNWLEPIADSVQRVLGDLLAPLRPAFTDVMHGVWLGHPLHPLLTDVPIGAATAGMLIDAIDLGAEKPRLGGCADTAWVVATAAMVPTAAAGITDWRHVDGYARRVGLVHGTLNVASLLLNTASLVARLSGNRSQGAALSSLGYLSSTAAAWLGGQLVYEEMIGVDHATLPEGPADFVSVMPESELPEGQLHKVTADGASVLLFRRGREIYAIGETCAHAGGPLSEGMLGSEGNMVGETVTCPWHGSQYRLRDGTVVHGPSVFNLPCYQVRVQDGQIQVRRSPTL
ncbi:MAG: Rieske 2Fe-2S domain-containing protein [Chloroflexi bacterium]|nr:Rieske 2Fe-2S domain-containing protein [Chloroflexota bacterium]